MKALDTGSATLSPLAVRNKEKKRETNRQRDRETKRQTDREIQRDRKTERQEDRETERQRNRETERPREMAISHRAFATSQIPTARTSISPRGFAKSHDLDYRNVSISPIASAKRPQRHSQATRRKCHFA
jgi:hypothetical protein